jgi:5'-methylthioadenosine phosphorylase
LPDLAVTEVVEVETPHGAPSGKLTVGRLGETETIFLPRHGHGHRLSPTELPYRANIYALKQLGVTHLLSVSAVGSLREDLPPRSLVLPDQIIDRTVARERTYFENGIVAHVGLAWPYCPDFRLAVWEAAKEAGHPITGGGCYICIEGPQFSTRAESVLYRHWDAAVIGMTAMPEARLAREAELCYATLAMVTDYDVWHDSEGPVTVEMVLGNLQANAEAGRDIVRAVARRGLSECDSNCRNALANAIITDPALISDGTKRRLGVIGARYLSDSGADQS